GSAKTRSTQASGSFFSSAMQSPEMILSRSLSLMVPSRRPQSDLTVKRESMGGSQKKWREEKILRFVVIFLAARLASSCLGIVTAPIKAAADVTGDLARAGVGAAIPDGDDEKKQN